MTETIEQRPLVTFALFAYNQEKYIREAVEGAFSQTYEPLEIILSDDCSSDRTFEIMQEMAEKYEGPATLHLRRSPENQGLTKHINSVVKLSSGEILIFSAGDDISLKNRTEITVKYMLLDNKISFINFNFETIDQNSKRVTKYQKILTQDTYIDIDEYLHHPLASLKGAARSIRRTVIDYFGPLNEDCPTEDSPFLLRALLLGRGMISSNICVRYRIHKSNLSSRIQYFNENHYLIEKQYNKDIDLALSRGLINDRSAEQIRILFGKRNNTKPQFNYIRRAISFVMR